MARFLLGSVSTRVVQYATCAVLVQRVNIAGVSWTGFLGIEWGYGLTVPLLFGRSPKSMLDSPAGGG